MNKVSSLYAQSHLPLYAQVASVMRQRIEAGVWSKGDRISTLEELEAEFEVARVTVRQAIDMLRKEGLLDVQQGRGTFISGAPREEPWVNLTDNLDGFLASIRENVIKRVSIEENVKIPDLAQDEGQPAEAYAFLRSVQYNRGRPFSVVNLHLAQDIFADNRETFSHSSALPELLTMPDVAVARVFQTITIGVADPSIAGLLKIGLGEPIANCRTIVHDANGVAIYVARISYLKNCFALRMDLLDKNRPISARI